MSNGHFFGVNAFIFAPINDFSLPNAAGENSGPEILVKGLAVPSRTKYSEILAKSAFECVAGQSSEGRIGSHDRAHTVGDHDRVGR